MAIKFEMPLSVTAMLSLLHELGGRASIVAGGTDWVISRGKSPLSAGCVAVDISKVEEMRNICIEGDTLLVGASVTMAELASDGCVAAHARALAEAALSVGSPQIRSRATVGGNAANASPAADTVVALSALDAFATVASAGSIREVPVGSIASGIGKNSLMDGEVITGFKIPLSKGSASAFVKLGSRFGMSIARLNAAAFICEGTARVRIGTLGVRPVASQAAEDALLRGDACAFSDALAAAVDEAIPGRYSQKYKRTAVTAFGEDLMEGLRI